MDGSQPSTSAGFSSAAAGSSHSMTASTSGSGESSEVIIRQSRKRPAPSSSSSSPVPYQMMRNGELLGDTAVGFTETTSTASLPQEFSDFVCSICMETMNEPTSTHCGHTYCQSCILDTIDNSARCPKCGTHLSREKICPNFALSDVMARSRRSNAKAIKAEVFESSSSTLSSNVAPPGDVVKFLTNSNYEHLSLNEVDRLVMVLLRRREIMASDDEEYKRKMLDEFLNQLLKIKNAQMDQLNREITLIKRDLEVNQSASLDDNMIDSGGGGGGLGGSLSSGGGVGGGGGSSSSSAIAVPSTSKMDPCSSSSGIGFNTQPLRNVELEQQSLSARKKRMYNHFDELTQVYFDTRSSDIFDNRNVMPSTSSSVYDATVPNGQIDNEDREVLDRFGRTLSHITQYHGLKPLATLSYSADMLSNSNIVSSIEFDKDNEFFAIAGVTKKIKLFEYLNVIGSAVDIHCPSAELSCNAKISCVAWSNYYKNSLASSDYDGCVSLWDVSTCTRVRSLVEHEKRVWSVDWSNGDPRLLASGSDDSKVKLWSTNVDKSIANLEAKANVCCVKFCPESTYVIAFGSADHCVHYYDFRSPKEPLGVLYGHKKAVSYVKFASKDELVSASTDSNLKLWNLDESMNCTRSFTGHINEKNFVGLATDGNYIACGSENNSLYLYYKYLPKPLFSFKFENHRSMLERPKPDESPEFVSAVAWKKGSPVVVAANSQGAIKILELV